jgi:hypothetical protein
MKASQFPREYKAYDLDTSRMLQPQDLISEGFTLSPDGLPANSRKAMFDVVLLWFSGQFDKNRKKIFEGDICRVQVKNEFGSLTVDYGIMKWISQTSQFVLTVPASLGGRILDVTEVELLGNEFENPELVSLVKNEAVETVNG